MTQMAKAAPAIAVNKRIRRFMELFFRPLKRLPPDDDIQESVMTK